MRLYKAVSANYARRVIDEGFVGVQRIVYDEVAFS
jgi:hypothetical protein